MIASDLNSKYPDKKRSVSSLVRFIKNRSHGHPAYCFLLGAGASVTSGISTASDLVKIWKQEVFFELTGRTNCTDDEMTIFFERDCQDWYKSDNEYTCFFERLYDSQSQRRTFVEKEVENKSPSIGYAYLTNLVKENFFNTVLTTNFDDLLNEAFFRFTEIRPYVCAHDSSVRGLTVTSKRPKVIKLHGDYLYDSIQCTGLETLSLKENMKDKMNQFCREYGLIVSGYSGSDESVMSVLKELLLKQDYLTNGIYWCLRSTDSISNRLAEFFSKERVYYVFVDGFDDLMAEIHAGCTDNESPFIGTESSDKIYHYAREWVEKIEEFGAKSTVIQGHLDGLKKKQNTRSFASALSEVVENKSEDTMMLKLDEQASLMRIVQLVEADERTQALSKIEQLLTMDPSEEFKKILLYQQFAICEYEGSVEKASKIADEMILTDSDNPAVYLYKERVVTDSDEKMQLISKAIDRDDYFYKGHFTRGKALTKLMNQGLKPKSQENINLVIDSYNMSVKRRPALSNPAWKCLAEFALEYERFEVVDSVVHSLQCQDRYRPSVCEIISLLAREKNSSKIKIRGEEIDLVEYLSEAVEKYYPRDDLGFWDVIVDSSVELGQHQMAQRFKSKFENIKNNRLDAEFVLAMSKYFVDIEKNISKAISYLEDSFSINKDYSILLKIIELLSFEGDVEKSRRIFEINKKIFGRNGLFMAEACLLDAEGKFDSAIDVLSRKYALSKDYPKYVEEVSYFYLRDRKYGMAEDICNEYFRSSDFSRYSQVIVVNYEFARYKNNKPPRKKKLEELLGTTKKKDVIAVAHLLLGDKDKCLELLSDLVKKRFSKLIELSRWPVLEGVKSELLDCHGVNTPLRAIGK